MFRPKLLRLSNAQNQIHFRKKKLECIWDWETSVRSRAHRLTLEKSGSHRAHLVLTWMRFYLTSLLSLVLTQKTKKKPKISILGTGPECKQRGTGPSGCLWQVYICNTGHTSLKPNKDKDKDKSVYLLHVSPKPLERMCKRTPRKKENTNTEMHLFVIVVSICPSFNPKHKNCDNLSLRQFHCLCYQLTEISDWSPSLHCVSARSTQRTQFQCPPLCDLGNSRCLCSSWSGCSSGSCLT